MSRFGRVVGLVGSCVREFFKPVWRRVVAVVVVVGVGVGVGVWRFEVSQVEGLRREASGVEELGYWWMGRPVLRDEFSRYVAETERGVDFPGWKVKPDAVGRVRTAVESYDDQAEVSRRVSYEHLVEVIGPGLREVSARMEGTWRDPVDDFFTWCKKKPTNLVYADTLQNRVVGRVGEKVNLPDDQMPTNYAIANKIPGEANDMYEFSSGGVS